MASAVVLNFFLAVMISLFLCFSSSHARQRNLESRVVLGLTPSRTILPSPKTTSFSVKKPSESQDMMEPLTEIRDGYVIPLNVGTPSQVIQVYMDTGSDLTWFPCGNLSFNCIKCDDYKNANIRVSFSPFSSTSSERDSCSSSFCIDLHSTDNYYDPCTIAGCSLNTLLKSTCSRPCPSFAYTYGEGVVTGILAQDTLRVHAPGSLREIQRFRFGCVGSAYKEPIGIVGFGKGSLSLPSQLGLQKGFSHCFLPFKFANNPNISSPLLVGDQAISSEDDHMQFTPMLKCPMFPNFYYIGLEAITVGNVTSPEVPESLREFDSHGNGGMLIDSGTTYTHLPEPLYTNLLSVLQSMITHPRAKDVEMRSGFDLCYRIPCPDSNTLEDDDLPPITFHFLNNSSLPFPQGNSFYPMNAPVNFSVVKCLLFQSMVTLNMDQLEFLAVFNNKMWKLGMIWRKKELAFNQLIVPWRRPLMDWGKCSFSTQ